MRVVVADDEELARARIRALLATEPDVELVGEARTGEEALAAIEAQAPDLVFLDIRMPVLDGLEVAARLGARLPRVVFVTAYDRYAVRAFDLNALDYLLKPFDEDRFREALARARTERAKTGRANSGSAPAVPPGVEGPAESPAGEAIAREVQPGGGDAVARLLAALRELRELREPETLDRLVARQGQRAVVVRAEEIAWIGAEGNYVRLHGGGAAVGRTHLLRRTMAQMEKRLDPRRFVRIHRSTMVNVERIRSLEPVFHGEWSVLLDDGTRLTLSRHYRARLEERLGGF